MPDVITTYNIKELTMLGALFTYNGTILDSSFTFLQAAFLQLLAWGFVGFFYALDSTAEDLTADNIEDAIRLINTVLSFSLGLYVSVSINRWWEMRGAVGAVIGATSTMIMMLCMFAPNDEDPRLLNLKRKVVRFGTASVALQFVEEERLAKLTKRGLLTKREGNALKGKKAQAMILWLWIGSLLQRAFVEGMLLGDIKVIMKLMKYVHDARDSIQKVNTFTNVQLPLPYVHVIICIAKLVFLMLTFQGACKMYVALYEGDYMALMLEMLILWVVPIIYQGLIDLTEKISNPFGGDEIDFPGEMYQKALLAQCHDFIESASHPPDWTPRVADLSLLRAKSVNDAYQARSRRHSNAASDSEHNKIDACDVQVEPRLDGSSWIMGGDNFPDSYENNNFGDAIDELGMPSMNLELDDIFMSEDDRGTKRKSTKSRVKSLSTS